MNILLLTLIFFVFLESSILRPLFDYKHPMLILNAEIVVIGISLLIETIAFIKLSRKVFGNEFAEE